MREQERTSEIHRGARHLVVRVEGEKRLVGKQLLPEVADAGEMRARLLHEHDLLATLLLPGVVRARGCTDTAGGPVLWLEDAGPCNLGQWLGGKPLAVPVFLRMAIQITENLAGVHSRGIIHRDLSPGNLVVDGEQLTLIDFETAAVLKPSAKENLPAAPEAELLYAAPEQTGRMNRSVDQRADLYSLGAIFYEMLSGTPPFPIGDPIELVHAHLARAPRPLTSPHVPALLSDLVLRLLAKTPERRYQSAAGLLADLREAASRLQPSGSIAPFELGQADLGLELLSGNRLYGREREIDQLRSAWERTRAGGREVVLVTGEAGAGKSELLRTLRGVVAGSGGRFIGGKADMRRPNTPFAPIVDALRALVRELALAPRSETALVRDRLAEALRRGAGLITDLVPELESFIGPSPSLPAVGPPETEGRFFMVFTGFVAALASEEHPLVLFVDDLQWADSGSATLIRRLAAAADLRHFLLLLACRTEGPDEAAAIVDAEVLREAGTPLCLMPLGPLPASELTALCGDLLDCEDQRAQPLAELLAGKSGGNPLFFRRLLRHLQQEELLVRDPGSNAWTWDLERIATVGVTDNVGELMAAGLRRLSPAAQALLGAGACVGRTFKLGLLADVLGMPLTAAAAALREAAAAGQVQALDRTPSGPRPEDRFQFAHDRVQQAAYGTVSGDERTALHLRIGRTLLSSTVGDSPGQQLFEIVDQLNLGADLIAERAERLRVAALGCQAERRARAASAYGPALEYLRRALPLLPADSWQSDYELTFALHRDGIECAFWIGEVDLASRLFETALGSARSHLDRAELYRTRFAAAYAAADFPGAVHWGREGLAVLGVALPAADDQAAADAELAQAKQRLAGRPLHELLDAQVVQAPELLAAMDLLSRVNTAAYFVSPALWMFSVARVVNLTVQHGPALASAEGLVSLGAVLLFQDQQPARAHELGRLGVSLARKMGNPVTEFRATAVFVAILHIWRDPIDESFAQLQRLHPVATEAGELLYAFGSMVTATIMLFHRGAELGRVLAQIDATLKLVVPGISRREQQRVLGYREAVHRLRGIAGSGHQTPEGTVELGTSYLMGDLAGARALVQSSSRGGPVTRSVHMVERCFYSALTSAALHEDAPPDERPALLAAVAANQRQLQKWAEGCPENFQHKALLLGAELARLEGRSLDAADLYDRAAADAAANRFLQDEGLANEHAARFHRAQGRSHFAGLYAARAVAAYARWGARAKVEALQDEFPTTTEEPAIAAVPATGATMDLVALFRAAEALSREVVLERLCGKLIDVCLATAGAERAVLMLAEEGGLYVRALGSVQGGAESLREPLAESRRVPAGIIAHVLRTREPLVLADASHHRSLGADSYVAAHGVRSALALPILHQAQLVGALYLENNLATRVFVPERVRLLQILSSQIATALQNSQLFERLIAEVEERKRAEAAIRFVADAGIALTESLDYQATLAKVASLAVPTLADCCLVYAFENETVRLAAAAHRDPARGPGQLPEVPAAVAERLRAQTAVVVEPLTPGALPTYAPTSALQEMVRALAPPAAGMIVPLALHGRPLGVMALVMSGPERAASARTLAEELARRAAVAIENARLYREAQETIRIRDEFSSIASHELKTPLSSLRLLVDGFAEDALGSSPEAASRAVAIISRQTRRLESLVGDLIDMAGIRSGRLAVHVEPVELTALVRDLAERFAPQLAIARCPISVEAPTAVWAAGDRGRLDQVLGNLLSNAIKFGAGHPITIRTWLESEVARVAITDRGIGIPQERISQIFGRFERAVSYDYGGLGLGLYIANQLVTAMGGRITVESSVRVGSCFTVEVPAGARETGSRPGTRPASA